MLEVPSTQERAAADLTIFSCSPSVWYNAFVCPLALGERSETPA